jgi:hypothetical protein
VPKEVTLTKDEKVLMVLRRVYASFAVIVTVGLVILAVILLTARPFLPVNLVYPLYFLCFVILPIVLYGLGYFYVRGHHCIITNYRIIMFRKFLGILIRSVACDKITDIIVSQGPFARLFNYGGIAPMTAGITMPFGMAILSLSGVRNPYEVRDSITKLLRLRELGKKDG